MKKLLLSLGLVILFVVMGCSESSNAHKMRGPRRFAQPLPPVARHMPPEFRHYPRLGQRDRFHNKPNKSHKHGKFDGKRELHGRKHFKNIPAEKSKNFKNSHSHFSR